MKRLLRISCIGVTTFCIVAVSVSCRKSADAFTVTSEQVAFTSLPLQLNYFCSNAPDYGDSIVYLQPSNNDYIIKTVNGAALGKGKYFAWPAGMIIDSASGAINVSQSETGLRYIVGFVKQGTTDTCVKNLILAGVTYADSIYVLGNDDSLAIPYYNANPLASAVCDGSDDNDYPDDHGHGHGDDKCIFDGMDKHGKQGKANGQNVKVRTISGVINLKATLAAGAFGSHPADGASLTVPITYSLSDKSKKATQEINVKLVYYNKRSDIPAPLVNSIETNRQAFFANQPILGSPRPPVIVVSNFQ